MNLAQELQQKVKGLFKEASEGRNKPNEYRISELVLCPRKAFFYRKLGTQPKQTGKMYAGSLFHSRIPKIVKELKEFENAQFEVECSKDHHKFKILGHADTVAVDTVYEFKFSAANLDKYGMPAHWMLQANAYATLLEKKYWKIVMVNSNTLEVAIMPGFQNLMGYNVLLDRALEIHSALESGKPPEGPVQRWECIRCTDLEGVCGKYFKEAKGNER